MLGLAAGDQRFDAPFADKAAVLVVVVAAVGEQRLGSPSRPADTATDGRYPVEQIEQL